MGKNNGRRKKSSASADKPSTPTASQQAETLQSPGIDPVGFLKQAHELKDEGNRHFQAKDYAGALEQYELALRILPPGHLERAVFHSNRAACFLQVRPVDHEAVACECSLALQAQPRYARALLRRARAYESLRRFDLALQDVNCLLGFEPSNADALDLAGRLRVALSPASRPSPAALGASAVRATAPIAGLGPCLPSRQALKKPTSPSQLLRFAAEKEKSVVNVSLPVVSQFVSELSLSPALDASRHALKTDSVDEKVSDHIGKAIAVCRLRPLKLVYDHDIRLSEMPVDCSFKLLREIVGKRFPSSKAILLKYRDLDGDLVTITSTCELRLAESCAEEFGGKKEEENIKAMEKKVQVLRLFVMEVSPEQEPFVPDEEVINNEEEVFEKSDEDCLAAAINTPVEEQVVKKNVRKECSHEECIETSIDDWIYEFAQLFRLQVGIDPEVHVDLQELGMELCTEALEQTITSEEAQELFDMAAIKFQEVATLAFFNWGNVYMCSARKRIPLNESMQNEAVDDRLQEAYDWVKEKYDLAGQKYEEALKTKPDFYEGLLALGQQQFETAKLHWSFALASKVDLKTWDFSVTIDLFSSAEEKMKSATAMWEKAEEQRMKELKDPMLSKKVDLLKKRKLGSMVDGQGEISAEEAAEQVTLMRSQMHLFWGNLLFERSQVEFKLGFDDWETNFNGAVERFKLAGASESDISVVLKNHLSNGDNAQNEEIKPSNLKDGSFKVLKMGEDPVEVKI